ncbi:hypothetical protein [Photobacterium damselae]|uniref:hypothetical protein n=1 Tax=Photobacterium damselae TaxID=38293 RepID=UPI000D663504|nr:hypothetical protein [Photobacterium damselae]AWK84491.1 hypothetical protein BST98_20880 [Photobacterium damselae]
MGRNWDFSKQRGKERRLQAELDARLTGVPVPRQPPFWSHDGTLQHYFNLGWQAVPLVEIELHCNQQTVTKPKGDRLSMLRSLRQCHLR